MKTQNQTEASFLALLDRLGAAWKRWQALALLLRVARWAVVSLALYLVADYFLALDETPRRVLNLALPLSWLAAALPDAWRIMRTGQGTVASHADRIARHRRNELLTAWELLRARSEAPSEEGVEVDDAALSGFLVRRSVDEARIRAAALPSRRLRPAALLARQGRLLAVVVLAAAGVIVSFGPDAIVTVVPRLLWPGRDIPPFSRYRFAVAPQRPAILYGGSAELSVTISGAPVRDQVWLLTRDGARGVQRAACFQEGVGSHAQRLENVTRPISFCFAVGRARSRWHEIDLQLQPQVLQAGVELIPPPYTGLPPVAFPAGQADVAGVRGTRVVLTLDSNRPLRGGTLTLRRRGGVPGDEQVIEARLATEFTAEFDWVLNEDAEACVTLRDLRGTSTAEPLVLPQRRLEDETPQVALAEPPEFSLATTGAVLNVSGQADDDFGLERIDWVRGLVGFHDRGVTLRSGPIGRQAEIAMPLDLGALGVEPGQTIELYLETLDNNPHLAGVAGSGIARVKIVSDEEYAEVRRSQETLEDFLGRYRAGEAAMAAVLESLEYLRGAVSNRVSQAELEAAIGRAAAAHEAAAATYAAFERDFAIYDVERALGELAGRVVNGVEKNRRALSAMAQAPGQCTIDGVGELVARLQDDAGKLAEQTALAEDLVRVARVMDAAARFQALVQRQAELVRRLMLRYGGVIGPADRPFLAGYGDEQGEIARELADFMVETAEAAGALPETVAVLRDHTREFLWALAETGASNHMSRAGAASRNSDARQTTREAQLALEKLRALLPEGEEESGNCFAGLCAGNQPAFGAPDTAKTIQAMFRSLCRRRGVGSGSQPGSGRGIGGAGFGFGASGYSELSMPVYGPARSRAGRAGRAGGDGLGEAGAGAGGRGGAGGRPALTERLRSFGGHEPTGESLPQERLPPRYREAVRRYFGPGLR